MHISAKSPPHTIMGKIVFQLKSWLMQSNSHACTTKKMHISAKSPPHTIMGKIVFQLKSWLMQSNSHACTTKHAHICQISTPHHHGKDSLPAQELVDAFKLCSTIHGVHMRARPEGNHGRWVCPTSELHCMLCGYSERLIRASAGKIAWMSDCICQTAFAKCTLALSLDFPLCFDVHKLLPPSNGGKYMKQLACYADISNNNFLIIHASSEKKTSLLAYNSSQLTCMHITYTPNNNQV